MAIVWKVEAREDYFEIFSFLKQFLGSEKAHKKANQIISDISILETSPQIGKKLTNFPIFRNIILGKYRIVYHYNISAHIITILGVYHSAYQGYEKRLNSIDIS